MKRVYDFLRLRWVMIAISLVLIVGGIVGYFVRGGLNFGVDFTSGLVEQVQIRSGGREIGIADVRAALAEIEGVSIQAIGQAGGQQFMIKVLAPSEDNTFQTRMENRIQSLLADAFGADNVVLQQSDFVGPRYAGALGTQTVSIMAVALALILIYTAFRFRFIYAAAAVLCLVHDSLVMLGVIAVFRLEVTTSTVAAILTIIGYSLNDTIIIFDRVRENRGLMRDSDLGTIINTSISQSLSRTILTSLTTLLAIVTIYIIGTGDIQNFALNLIIGIVVGTYSTIFIASPIALEWTRALDRRRKRRDIQRYGKPAGALPPAERPPGAAPIPAGLPEEGARISREAEAGAELIEAGRQEVRERPQGPPRREGPVQVTRTQPTRKKKKKRR